MGSSLVLTLSCHEPTIKGEPDPYIIIPASARKDLSYRSLLKSQTFRPYNSAYWKNSAGLDACENIQWKKA